MNIFTESGWNSDKVGDKLSKLLFQKKSKEKKKVENEKIKALKSKKSNSKNKRKNLPSTNGGIDNSLVSSNIDNTKREFINSKRRKNKPSTQNFKEKLNHHRTLQSSSISSITKSKKKRSKKKEKKNLEKRLLTLDKSDTAYQKTNIKRDNKKLNIEKLKQLLVTKDASATNASSNKNIRRKAVKDLSLREQMLAQLQSSRFRFLNETLYNNESKQSLKLFKEDPEAFKAYHVGYQNQVERWPLNPLDTIISAVKKMPKDYVIVDFGCGEAKLARSVEQKVHSIDLVTVNDRVTACDMAHTPLLTDSANVVIFCLSLMGSNLADYIMEANRILKQKGILKIAEVESRFDDVNVFIKILETYGFKITWQDLSHNLFYFMDFKKVHNVNRSDKNLSEIKLKPCLYKKR